MVNLCDERACAFMLDALFSADGGFRRSFQRSSAAREMRPFVLLVAFLRARCHTRASVHCARPAKSLATLQNPLSCSMMKAHNDFGLPIFECGLEAGIKSAIRIQKSPIASVAPAKFNAYGSSGFNFCASRRRLPQCASFAARLHL